jgi:hypothetical protein
MKTTVEIADQLLTEARRAADRRGTTLKALIEEGLRLALKDQQRTGAFRLRRASFKGEGLQAPLRDGDWERVRDLSYEGRGA